MHKNKHLRNKSYNSNGGSGVYYGSSPRRSLSPERFSGKLTNLSDQQVKKALERRELKEAKAQTTMDIGKMASIVQVYSSVQNNNHNKDLSVF